MTPFSWSILHFAVFQNWFSEKIIFIIQNCDELFEFKFNLNDADAAIYFLQMIVLISIEILNPCQKPMNTIDFQDADNKQTNKYQFKAMYWPGLLFSFSKTMWKWWFWFNLNATTNIPKLKHSYFASNFIVWMRCYKHNTNCLFLFPYRWRFKCFHYKEKRTERFYYVGVIKCRRIHPKFKQWIIYFIFRCWWWKLLIPWIQYTKHSSNNTQSTICGKWEHERWNMNWKSAYANNNSLIRIKYLIIFSREQERDIRTKSFVY